MFLVTDDKLGHFHAVILDENDGSSYVSQDVGHGHYPAFIPVGQLVDLNSFSEENVIEVNGQRVAYIFDTDIEPHVHTLRIADEKTIDWLEDDEDELKEQKCKYDEAIELEKDSIESGIESEGFVIGGSFQWDGDVLETRRKAGKPSLSINVIQPMIDTLFGIFTKKKTD